ncbi:glycosyltransferase family 2 protein [Bacteroides xylanisolvens]|uniref:glycosyltransferase family 2 protein n=1 Tax=Bacteroides xylanisolvens TaxID=371601 RepID=UPI00374E5443
MKDYGLVSIITPTYNSAEFVRETIDSIIAQTYTNWELLITDDQSTDDTFYIIEKYVLKDKRIKVFQLSQNGGAGVARNNSIKEAQGSYIAFCDSDDKWCPNKLEKQLLFMSKMNCVFSYTSYLETDEEGKLLGIDICNEKETLYSIIRNNRIGCLTAMYNVEVVGKVYMPTIRKRQDWGLWILLLQKCHIAYGLMEPLSIYRVRKGSLSNKKWNLVKYNIALYENVLSYSNYKAILVFLFKFSPSYLCYKLKKKIRRLFTSCSLDI